jgi:hypothetical protein
MEDGLDTLGAEDVMGIDYGSILQAAGGLATAGVSAAEQKKKEDEAKADEDKKVKAAIAADQAAASAMATADLSAQAKGPSMAIDAQAAQMAISAQDAAGAGLSADGQKKRAAAADATLAAVVKAAQARPTDLNQKALVKAWTTVANKAHAGAISPTPGSGLDIYGGQSWFTRPVWGRVPGAGVLAISAGALGVVGFAVKKFFFSKGR